MTRYVPIANCVVISVLIVAVGIACGGERGGSARPQTPTADSPPIQTINRPIADSVVKDFGISLPSTPKVKRCLLTDPDARTPSPEKCENGDSEAPVPPAADPAATVVAKLRLSSRRNALFITFRSAAGGFCFDIQVVGPGWQGALPLECFGAAKCERTCLGTVDASEDSEVHEVVAGTVPFNADRISVVYGDGSAEEFGLAGPVVEAIPQRRVFMLDIGGRGFQRATISEE
jgi:hypothetical protein